MEFEHIVQLLVDIGPGLSEDARLFIWLWFIIEMMQPVFVIALLITIPSVVIKLVRHFDV